MVKYKHEKAFTPYGERNPYYPEPIVPDAIHHGPIHNDYPPKPKTVTVEENIKLAEIKDAFNNLRYKVSLTSFDSCYIPNKKQYQIQVLAYNGYVNPIIIVDRPSGSEGRIYNYDYALKLYNQYVTNYTHLIEAETTDFQDITLYKEQIGYKITAPKCCFTCKWCKKSNLELDFQLGAVGKLECHNPKSCQAYNFDSSYRHQPWNTCNCSDPRQHTPNCFEYEHMCLDVHPEVDLLGVCDNYDKNIGEWHPYPGQRVSEIVNMQVVNKINETVPTMVNNTISTELTTTLSAPIYDAVVVSLKQPEISSSMVEPVANVILNEQVSSKVVLAVSQGITLDKIIGNSDLNFNDTNNNNIPDEYENDIVIGGEGA